MEIRPRIRSLKNDGQKFWLSQNPDQMREHGAIVGRIEREIFSDYGPNYASPLVARAMEMSFDGFERQYDHESCGYNSLVNAMRLLDEKRPEYSMPAIKEAMWDKGLRAWSSLDPQFFNTILELGFPYTRFKQERLPFRETDAPYRVRDLFAKIHEGAAVVWTGWFSPVPVVGANGIVDHARLLAGFSTDNDGKLTLYVVDPYHSEERRWSLNDFIVASHAIHIFREGAVLSDKALDSTVLDAAIIKRKSQIRSIHP